MTVTELDLFLAASASCVSFYSLGRLWQLWGDAEFGGQLNHLKDSCAHRPVAIRVSQAKVKCTQCLTSLAGIFEKI